MIKLSIYYVIPQTKEIEVDESVIERYDKTGDIIQLLEDCDIYGAESAYIETENGEMILDLN